MGLDTTHGAWHGPYSSFNNFRKDIAAQIGINLDYCHGFGFRMPHKTTIDLSKINHPITTLLRHSDCDGELSVDECRKTVTGIDQILDSLNKELIENHELFMIDFLQFKRGCLKAIEKNEPLEFC